MHPSFFRLHNASSSFPLEAVVTNVGASLQSLSVPDKTGRPLDVVLGFGKPEDYFDNAPSLGAVVGRYAGRLAGASIPIGDAVYSLDANAGPHTLHSGFQRYAHRIWSVVRQTPQAITFSLESPDGDQGFPGDATITVTYTLEENALRLDYHAVANKDTVFNLTNHSYFNLEGHAAGSVLDHNLALRAERFAVTDADTIPTGELCSVAGTALDFRTPTTIGARIDAPEETMMLAKGYDHAYALSEDASKTPVAWVCAPGSGIVLELTTDSPCLVFYTANYLTADPRAKEGAVYAPRSGFCLETQFFPDSPHHKTFPDVVFPAGTPYTAHTRYVFSHT